jgi:VWFA-related protein
VVDNSGSMRDKRAKVNAAALVFVKSSNPQDEVFIVNFNDEAFLDKDFTANLEELREGLEKIDSRGGTALHDALVMSLDHLQDRGQKARRVLLVVSDGVDNASRYTLEQAVRVAHESETVIYVVGLLSDEGRDKKRARRALETIAEASGGAAFFPDNLNDVEALATRIAHDIRNQYVISYTPANAVEDGSFRSIRVTAAARGHDKLMVRTRSGYYAGKSGPGSSLAPRAGRGGN